MYRFIIDGESWILRFSPHIYLESEERQEIVALLIQIGKDLLQFSHGNAFCIFHDKLGLLVFDVEKVPSFILTISNVVLKENWYIHKDSQMKPYIKGTDF